MELLVALIVEFIVSAAAPIFFLIIDLIAAFVAMIGHIIFGRPARRRRPSRQRSAEDPAASTPETTQPQEVPLPANSSAATAFGSKLFLAGAGLFGAIFVVCMATVIVANYLYLTPSVKWLAGKITDRSGIEISFADVKGNLISGNLAFKGLEVSRRNTSKTEFAFKVDKVDLDVSVFSLAFGEAQLSKLAIDGVTGDIWSKARDKGAAVRAKAHRRQFEIGSLKLTDVDIRLHRSDTPSVLLTIDSLKTERLRSRYVVFDVFFRSDISGRIDGKEIYIASARKIGGRTTRWRLHDFPAELVRHYVDKAPFKWFENGSVDVLVEDNWTSADRKEIDTTWRFVLKDVKVVEPDNSSLVERALGTPIARYINSRDKDIEFSMRFVMDEEQFRLKSSLDAAGVWDAVLGGTARALAENSKETADEIKQNLKQSIGKFKDFLNEKRKKRSK